MKARIAMKEFPRRRMNGADAAGQLVMNEMSRLRKRRFSNTAVMSEAKLSE